MLLRGLKFVLSGVAHLNGFRELKGVGSVLASIPGVDFKGKTETKNASFLLFLSTWK